MVDRYNVYGQRLDDHDPLGQAHFVRSSDYDTLAAELAAMTNDQKAILALTAEIERLHQRNEELRSANGYAELEARLAEAEALLRDTVHPTQYAVIPPGWVYRRDAFLAADSAAHRETANDG